tara:strand:- start:351 stop:806 length:456 start_codon:yes stop_codon:yes gene_type:complete
MAYQLIYRSKARAGISGPTMEDIRKTARLNNTSMGITGCLVYCNGYFLQIMEGEEDTVRQLFYTIEDDIRHDDVEILHQGIDTALFDHWGTVFTSPEGRSDRGQREIPRKDIDDLMINGGQDSFALKVFWYNVRQLCSKQGFYRMDTAITE